MIVVVGSGVAGCSAALAAVRAGADVTLVTAGSLDARAAGNSPLAQGGVAAAIGPEDRVADHLADTLSAGAGLTDAVAAEQLVRAGAEAMRALLADGFAADRDRDGHVMLGLEGAHGRQRIVHAGGDRTGAVLHAHLTARVRAAVDAGLIALREWSEVSSLVVQDGAVCGVVLRDAVSHGRGRGPASSAAVASAFRASDSANGELCGDAVVLATGGYASLYSVSSNHPGARGQGLLLAARAGAMLADLEFVQFHPTVLAPVSRDAASSGAKWPGATLHEGELSGPEYAGAEYAGAESRAPGFLISEAVRGAGAVLRDGSGERFMRGRHEAEELAPRDVVALEIHRRMRERGDSAVWLDATQIEAREGAGALERRFPSLTRGLLERGWDWRREAVPVAPAAHFTMGGVASDLDGRSSLPGLFVAGEVAANGVHGANRLASNSLLEGLVFGERAGLAAARHDPRRDAWNLLGAGMRALVRTAPAVEIPGPATPGAALAAPASTVARALSRHLGIERDAEGLALARRTASAALANSEERDAAELAIAIAFAAEARTESRGAHRRADFPEPSPDVPARRALRLAYRSPQADVAAAITHVDPAHEPRSVPAC
ncbi:L-aspartate oxidase [Leucobacter sp. USHLN153]|uniref:L-aspartate oxidase n=1 Tax=Leucobacter sp. USHLN153 TaxID=3081268 RepID=UPI003016B554